MFAFPLTRPSVSNRADRFPRSLNGSPKMAFGLGWVWYVSQMAPGPLGIGKRSTSASQVNAAFEAALTELEKPQYQIDLRNGLGICELHFDTPVTTACCVFMQTRPFPPWDQVTN
jgi:hypothetical protein